MAFGFSGLVPSIPVGGEPALLGLPHYGQIHDRNHQSLHKTPILLAHRSSQRVGFQVVLSNLLGEHAHEFAIGVHNTSGNIRGASGSL